MVLDDAPANPLVYFVLILPLGFLPVLFLNLVCVIHVLQILHPRLLLLHWRLLIRDQVGLFNDRLGMEIQICHVAEQRVHDVYRRLLV